MASPQCEDGFTKIANELLDALIRTNFSGYQRRVFDAILRKTYGFNKKEDWISNSQIVEMTGIKRSHVSRAKKELTLRNIVTKGGNKTQLNKDYDQWRQLPKGVTSHHRLPKGVTTVTKGGNSVLPKGGPTKETLTKETKQKKHTERNPDIKKFIDHYHNTFLERFNEKPMIDGGKDGKIIKSLLGTYEIDLLKELLDKFFNSPDEFILQSGYTIGVFKSQINKLIAGLKVDPKTASRFLTIKQWEINDGK